MPLERLTGRYNWTEISALRGEVKAVETGWAEARKMLYPKFGLPGSRAATALPMPATQMPGIRADSLADPNTQRPLELDPVSVRYVDFIDTLLFDYEEWTMIVQQGRVEQKIDEAYEAIYSRIMASLTAVFNAPEATVQIRQGDNTLGPIASLTQTLTTGATIANLTAAATPITADNVRLAQNRLANQQTVTGDRGFFRPRFLVSGNYGELYRITQSELASAAQDKNVARMLTPVHLPGMDAYWAVVSQPSEYGISVEFAAGREPFVAPPAMLGGYRVGIEFGAKFAIIAPTYQGTEWCEV